MKLTDHARNLAQSDIEPVNNNDRKLGDAYLIALGAIRETVRTCDEWGKLESHSYEKIMDQVYYVLETTLHELEKLGGENETN